MRLHLNGCRFGRTRIEIEAAVGERIGRDVENAHDERTGTELKSTVAWKLESEVSSGCHGKG